MKKIFYIASFALTFSLAGCDDFLTVESPNFSTDIYWRDKTDVEAGLSAVYGQLENRTDEYGFCEHKYPVEAFRGDDVSIGDDINNYPNMKDLYDYTYDNENAQTKEYWMNNYNGINYANNVIYGIDKVQTSGEAMSQEDYDHLMGEAVFLRALLGFYLYGIRPGCRPASRHTSFRRNRTCYERCGLLLFGMGIPDSCLRRDR